MEVRPAARSLVEDLTARAWSTLGQISPEKLPAHISHTHGTDMVASVGSRRATSTISRPVRQSMNRCERLMRSANPRIALSGSSEQVSATESPANTTIHPMTGEVHIPGPSTQPTAGSPRFVTDLHTPLLRTCNPKSNPDGTRRHAHGLLPRDDRVSGRLACRLQWMYKSAVCACSTTPDVSVGSSLSLSLSLFDKARSLQPWLFLPSGIVRTRGNRSACFA